MAKIINGIQQIGIGTANFTDSFQWYIDNFGIDTKIFDDNTVAALMLPYTGGVPHSRRAGLAINLQGGSGIEIWQYKDRLPEPPNFFVQLGDYGIYSAKVKCPDIDKAHKYLTDIGTTPLREPLENPNGDRHFFVSDPNGNIFDIIEDKNMYRDMGKPISGIAGAMIGVSNINDSLRLYKTILGYDKVVYDKQGSFDDFYNLPGGGEKFRRVLLTHSQPRTGGFGKLFGQSYIELVQCINRTPQKIFRQRLWGDIGFIHLCFDVKGMDDLEKECNSQGFPFTVNSNVNGRFDMGDAAGHFTYIEDPDGTLIEFVETYKVPLIKALGISINMEKKSPDEPIPDWLIKLLRIKKVRTAK